MTSRQLSFIEQDDDPANLKLLNIIEINKSLSHPCRRSISFQDSLESPRVMSAGNFRTIIFII